MYTQYSIPNTQNSQLFSDKILEKIELVSSKFAGMGKTRHILDSSTNPLATMLLQGDISQQLLYKRLQNLQKYLENFKEKKIDLHIKLDIPENLESVAPMVDHFLY